MRIRRYQTTSVGRFGMLLCCALFVLSACGQKGPLYHPDEKPPEQQPDT